MKIGYRYGRVAVIFLLGVLMAGMKGSTEGFSIFFGAGLLITAFLTLIYLFINFDKKVNEKLIMEMIMEAFAGLVIFTYPMSDNAFFVIVFSFWVTIMGVFLLTAGLYDKKNKDYQWFYILLGIVMILFGFTILHVTKENSGITGYLISFILLIYALAGGYLIKKRKEDIY